MIPARISLLVDWMHIREAERWAAGNHRALRSGRLPGATGGPDGVGGLNGAGLTPVGLALVEQTRFCRAEFRENDILLIDGVTQAPVHYQPHPELRAYLERWVKGLPVEPAKFVLTVVIEH